MNSQISRRESVFHRFINWASVVLCGSCLIVYWSQRGNAEALWRWQGIASYLLAAFTVLQLWGLATFVRDRGIMPAILVFMSGVVWLGFLFFPRGWLLLLSISLLGAGGIIAAWPQIRELVDRMSHSYREIAASDKS